MKKFHLAAVSLLAAVALSGCSTTNVTGTQSDIGNAKLPRPNLIVVNDFAATPADIASASPETVPYGEPVSQTPEEAAAGRKLGALVAKEVVSEINALGLTAAGGSQAYPHVGDIVIKGYFDSIDEGSATKRIMLGFGSGAANLRTVVVAYQMTNSGLRRLGSAEIDSGGNKTPGLLVPIAVVAATANPIGLVVGGAVKVAGEASGNDTIEGAAKRTGKQIGDQLETAFRKQGWIQ